MTTAHNTPSVSYGILIQEQSVDASDVVIEHVRNLGYAILDSGYTQADIQAISAAFDLSYKSYTEKYGETYLRNMNEIHTIRALMTHGDELFLELALNEKLISVIRRLIHGKFILNQQNGIINPPNENYNQGAWHRDLPYQHFVSSSPLAINALYCVDDFTVDNGGTFVLPASHHSASFPSARYIQNHALQIEAKAGSYILLDCMTFHTGGVNQTKQARRAVNHVFNIPFFKQQINIPNNLNLTELSLEAKEILGYTFTEPSSVLEYLQERSFKKN